MTAWATEGIAKLAARALPETLRALDIDPFGYEVSILACNDDDIAKFNATFRDKPVPTNVLSWPASEISLPEGGRPPPPEFGELGDIAIAFGICAREAREQGKPLQDHVTHMLVHGLLHCLGYDHIRDADAQVMEETERAILARLGIPDPY
ncbi:MAG: rRNA maturation RNase YbeY [Pseudomonadota bacterium]